MLPELVQIVFLPCRIGKIVVRPGTKLLVGLVIQLDRLEGNHAGLPPTLSDDSVPGEVLS